MKLKTTAETLTAAQFAAAAAARARLAARFGAKPAPAPAPAFVVDFDEESAELLVNEAAPACGCTHETDCAHAAHMRARPELAKHLAEHRRRFFGAYDHALRIMEAKAAKAA